LVFQLGKDFEANIHRSNDATTLIMCSSDGFCSSLAFAPGELGTAYHGPPASRANAPTAINTTGATDVTPQQTPTGLQSHMRQPPSSIIMPSPGMVSNNFNRPPTPTRSNSASSVASLQPLAPGTVVSNPTPVMTNLPTLSAANQTSHNTPLPPTFIAPTPPMTPQVSATSSKHASFPAQLSQTAVKREAEQDASDDGQEAKKRRIAPTLVSGPEPPT